MLFARCSRFPFPVGNEFPHIMCVNLAVTVCVLSSSRRDLLGILCEPQQVMVPIKDGGFARRGSGDEVVLFSVGVEKFVLSSSRESCL